MEQIENISALNKFKKHESTLKYANSTIELTNLKTIVEDGIDFFSTRLKNQINSTENSKLSSEQKVEYCFENNYFLNQYLLLFDKINLRFKLTSFETIKHYKFYNVQTLPFEKNNTTFEIFDKIISEKFATFGVDGFQKPFLIELIESYYNEMLQKSIELQRTFENQTQLTKNFNRLCIDWLNYILERYNEANIKEAPHYIKPFLDYCKAKEPKQTEVENNDCENEASNNGTNPHYPLMFVNENVYNCFLEYTEKHIIDFHTDYSYLKKRLQKLKLIHKHTDNDFMRFLLNDINLINQKQYEDYTVKHENKLKSLSKSYSIQRENNFNNVFESLL